MATETKDLRERLAQVAAQDESAAKQLRNDTGTALVASGIGVVLSVVMLVVAVVRRSWTTALLSLGVAAASVPVFAQATRTKKALKGLTEEPGELTSGGAGGGMQV